MSGHGLIEGLMLEGVMPLTWGFVRRQFGRRYEFSRANCFFPMIYWTLLFLLTLPIAAFLCRLAFGDLDSFVEAIVYFFTPIGAAAVASEAGDAFWAKLKLIGVVLAWISVVFGLHSTVGESLQGILP